MADDVQISGRTLKAVGVVIAIVTAAVSALAWTDARYAAAATTPTREELSAVRQEVHFSREELRELKSDVKEILRRLPR